MNERYINNVSMVFIKKVIKIVHREAELKINEWIIVDDGYVRYIKRIAETFISIWVNVKKIKLNLFINFKCIYDTFKFEKFIKKTNGILKYSNMHF